MALLKADKKVLAKKYLETLQGAKNAVILQQDKIPVNEVNKVRMELASVDGKLVVIKKRVFLKGIAGKYEGLKHEDMTGSVAVLYSYNEEDEHAPLKVIHKYTKAWKKEKLQAHYTYVGGWYDSIWKDGVYVGELAALPSKEELVGKFLFMLNHPVSSFARVIKAIAKKDEEQKEESWESTKKDSEVEVKEEDKKEEAWENEGKVEKAEVKEEEKEV